MAKKKKQEIINFTSNEISELQSEHLSKLESDPKYSLDVDPTNFYAMTDEQKKFIKFYIEFKSIATAAEFAEIDMNAARQYFIAYSSQQEIRRINMALYERQFSNRLLQLDEIGGYLSSLITDENVPIASQLKPMEKVSVIKMIIDLHQLKASSMTKPEDLMTKDFDSILKDLSISTIKQLLLQNKKEQSKIIDAEIISSDEDLSMEEKAYLSTLPTEELLNLIDYTNKEEDKNE